MSLIPIVGAFFRPPAKAILEQLPSNCPLFVVAEPTNQFDPNALAVFVETKSIPQATYTELEQTAAGFGYTLEAILTQPAWHLGYIPKELAKHMTPTFGSDPKPAKLAFTSSGKPALILESQS